MIFYFSLFDNDIRIVYNVFFKNKEFKQNSFNNDITFVKEKFLIFIISNIVIKLVFKVEYFFIMIAKKFVAYDYLIIT